MTEDQRPPLSEEAALRELEELQREIERTRLRRKDANEAFDRFLRSFDRHGPAPPIEEPVKRRPPMPPPPADFMPPVPRPDPPPLPLPPPAPEAIVAPPPLLVAEPTPAVEPLPERRQEEDVARFPPEAMRPRNREEPPLNLDQWEERSEPTVTTAAFPSESEAAARRATFSAPPGEIRPVPAALTGAGGRSRRIPPVIGVLGIVVAGTIAFFLWRGMGGDEGPADSAATATATPAAQPQPAPAPASPVAAPAAPQPPPPAEVSTVRRAWVRVVVDGRKVVERELPADSHIPLEPGSQYVVRAGDAGAVRLAIAGKDQGPVGADGQVATRTYTAAGKTTR